MINKKIIILGGNGFIGKNLIAYLVKRNVEVYSFDIRYPDKMEKNTRYLKGDFFNDDDLFNAIEDKDIIIHAITILNPSNSKEKYLDGYSLEFFQTVKLLDFISKRKKKLVYLSSGGTVYGFQKEFPTVEEQHLSPINHYGALKVCIETVIQTINYQNDSNILIARISNPYGPGQDYRSGTGFIDACIKNVIYEGTISIWGDGEIVRDYIFIEDVCKMIYSLMEYEGNEKVFNVSSSIGTSQNDIISIIKELGYKIAVQYNEKRGIDLDKVILCNKKIVAISNCQPSSLYDGINKTIDINVKKGVD